MTLPFVCPRRSRLGAMRSADGIQNNLEKNVVFTWWQMPSRSPSGLSRLGPMR